MVGVTKIKYHICKQCGQRSDCAADLCYVPDDWCGRERCRPDSVRRIETPSCSIWAVDPL